MQDWDGTQLIIDTIRSYWPTPTLRVNALRLILGQLRQDLQGGTKRSQERSLRAADPTDFSLTSFSAILPFPLKHRLIARDDQRAPIPIAGILAPRQANKLPGGGQRK